MYAYIEGKVVKLTEKQEKAFAEELENIKASQVVTDKDRISALESAIADLAIMLTGGVDSE